MLILIRALVIALGVVILGLLKRFSHIDIGNLSAISFFVGMVVGQMNAALQAAEKSK